MIPTLASGRRVGGVGRPRRPDAPPSRTPVLRLKIPVFSDPAPGKSYATTYEQMGSWATQPLAKIF